MDDVEGILRATMKADAAFRMLEAARNAMLEAYARTAGPATGR
jgi:flagellar hook-basal body complex protein FliE